MMAAMPFGPPAIGRRELLAAGAAAVGVGLAGRAEACSIVADQRVPFDDAACRAALREFVRLLNEGPSLSREQIGERSDEMNLSIDDDMVDYALHGLTEQQRNQETQSQYAFFERFRLSAGVADPRPIELQEVNRIRRLRNRASYQFTLRRYSYHPADWEGCNGLFTHDEYYGYDRTAYLATFWNNRLRSVKLFPEWYLEEEA